MYPIDSIFKVFADPEEDMLRIVTKDADRLLNRNYGVAELRLIIRKLNEQMIKTGLILNS